MNTESNNDEVKRADESELCPQCMTGNQPGAHFCGQCGTPLSSYAATGPFESLFAEGSVYRNAAEKPHRLIVVLGIWLIFGNMALIGLLYLADQWRTGSGLGVSLSAAAVSFALIIIVKTTRNYRRNNTLNGEPFEADVPGVE